MLFSVADLAPHAPLLAAHFASSFAFPHEIKLPFIYGPIKQQTLDCTVSLKGIILSARHPGEKASYALLLVPKGFGFVS